MKKTVVLLIALLLCFALCGCTGKYIYVGSESTTGGDSSGTSAPTTSGGTVSNVTVQGEADGEVEFTDPTSSSKPTVSGNKPSSNSSASGSTSSSNSTSSATSSIDPLENKENWAIVSFPTTPLS